MPDPPRALSPSFVRVTLAGDDLDELADNGYDQRVKLLLTPVDPVRTPARCLRRGGAGGARPGGIAPLDAPAGVRITWLVRGPADAALLA